MRKQELKDSMKRKFEDLGVRLFYQDDETSEIFTQLEDEGYIRARTRVYCEDGHVLFEGNRAETTEYTGKKSVQCGGECDFSPRHQMDQCWQKTYFILTEEAISSFEAEETK